MVVGVEDIYATRVTAVAVGGGGGGGIKATSCGLYIPSPRTERNLCLRGSLAR
jgi:hypothetical protein